MKQVNAVIGVFFLSALVTAAGQTNTDGSTPQYLFRDFSPALVVMKNGSRSGAMMNYNIVTEKMVYSLKEELYDMMNTELVDTVYLSKSKFVPQGRVFHEVVAEGPVPFFIQHKGTLMSAGTPAGYGGTSQVSNTKSLSSVELPGGYYNLSLPRDFTVSFSTVYWIRRGKDYADFTTSKQFLKLFPGREKELKDFIKKNKIKFDKPSTIGELGKYCNATMK
ncbi:MAG: hypothetical protein MUD02_02420 [Bacteroidales bacterium]|jgi:hypothetical protein|nr:hypothetical protein [Bacteroidales bacterium]